MKLRYISSAFITVLFIWSSCWANDIKEYSLTLKEAVGLALKQSRPLQIQKLKVEESGWMTREVKSGLYPQIEGTLAQSRQEVSMSANGSSLGGTAEYDTFNTKLGISQVIFNRSLQRAVEASKLQEEVSQDGYSASREAVTLQTIVLYLQTLRAKAQLDAAVSRVDVAGALKEQSDKFEKAGMGSRLEISRADLQYQNELQTLSETSVLWEQSKLALSRYIGIEQDQPIVLSDAMKYDETPVVVFSNIYPACLDKRPDYISAVKTKKALLKLAEKEKTASWPVVGLQAGAGFSGEDPSHADSVYSISLGVTWPIINGGRVEARYAQVTTQIAQQDLQIKEVESQIEYEVRDALLALGAASHQVESAQSGVKAAEITLKLTRSRYTAGVTTNIEVVDAQDTLARAQNNLIRAQFEYNLAKANLAKSMGQAEDLYQPEK